MNILRSLVSHPQEIADFILKAANEVAEVNVLEPSMN